MAFLGENTLQLYYEYDRNYETKPFHMSQVWRKEKKITCLLFSISYQK